jgi:hypothetical protein
LSATPGSSPTSALTDTPGSNPDTSDFADTQAFRCR